MENSQAALLFHWKSLRRQVRIEGPVSKVSAAEGDAYFATRSRDSQLGAWASDQSRFLESRELLKRRYEEAKTRFEGQAVPRPSYWGGFRVVPLIFEFWQDGPHRLHDRRVFVAQYNAGWMESLAYP